MKHFSFCVGLVAAALTIAVPEMVSAQNAGNDPIIGRNLGVSRERAAAAPRREGDQAVVDGWPLYRVERAQVAFNDAMATLKATQGPAPAAALFKTCPQLMCNLALPALRADGLIPAGRLWVSPSEYVLFVSSPRFRDGRTAPRRSRSQMRYFVFHEFENSSRNNDPYDTLASHSGSVFVPLYMSKTNTDAQGHRFVTVTQVAPYDVVSLHATNWGSAGPGMEVAKNASDPLEPLQARAGIVVASILETAAPQLQVVNHRNTEGLPMLTAYKNRLAAVDGGGPGRPGTARVALPFVPAPAAKVASATGKLADLTLSPGQSPRIPMAQRGFMPQRDAPWQMPTRQAVSLVLVEPPTPVARPR